jgi:Protein of unknown function (DUF1328)
MELRLFSCVHGWVIGVQGMPAGNFLYYALVGMVIAIIAAVLGFGGIAGAAAGIAKILSTSSS